MFAKLKNQLVLSVALSSLLLCCSITASYAQAATEPPSTMPNKLVQKSGAPVINIQHWQTAQGIPVYFVYTAQPNMIDFEVVFHAGSSYDGEKEGLALLTATLLDEGTAQLTADQIAQKFDDVGAIYHIDLNRDMSLVGLRSLNDPAFLTSAEQTFTQVLSSAIFTPEAFARVKKQILIGLAQEQQSPSEIAKKAFYRSLYGKQPYGHTITGNVESVSKLTRDDVVNFYKQYYVAKNAIINMVGNMTVEQAHQMAEQLTGSLPAGSLAPTLPTSTPLEQASNKTINFPSQQTTVFMGEIGITPHDAEFFPLTVGNYVLGGGMLVSRLFDIVREQHGLVYGISSQFAPMALRGPFVIFLQTRTEELQKALDLTQQIVTDFIQNGPKPTELEEAKKNIIGSFPLSFDSNGDIMEQLTFLSFYQLPLNYFDTFRENVNSVTVEQVRQAFQKYLDPAKLVKVTVGETTPTTDHASPEKTTS